MNETYEFTKVNDFAEDPAKHSVSFNTDTGKRIWIQADNSENPDIQFLRRAIVESKIIFVAYDADTGLCDIAAPFSKDYVQSMEATRETPPRLEVRLALRPSFLYLLPSHPKFDEILKLLQYAKEKNQMLWVGGFPGGNKILAVRLAPQ